MTMTMIVKNDDEKAADVNDNVNDNDDDKYDDDSNMMKTCLRQGFPLRKRRREGWSRKAEPARQSLSGRATIQCWKPDHHDNHDDNDDHDDNDHNDNDHDYYIDHNDNDPVLKTQNYGF